MLDEVKPCPFCGGEAHVQENGVPGLRYWEVVCYDPCDFCGPSHDTRDKAIAAWNRRAAPPSGAVRWVSRHGIAATRDGANMVIMGPNETDGTLTVPLYASPQSSSQVTEEMVRAGALACREITFDALTMDECRDAVRLALTAALSPVKGDGQ